MIQPTNVQYNERNKICIVSLKCPFCSEKYDVVLSEQECIDYYDNGKLAQNAMPTRTAEFREMLISGTCTKCQKKLFGISND